MRLIAVCFIALVVLVLLPLFSFFPVHYLYIDHLPSIETYKTYIGYNNGVTVEEGCMNVCLRVNVFNDIQYVELYKDSKKFFRLEYDPFTSQNDDDYIRYFLTNDDFTVTVVEHTVGKSPWWGHLKTGQWIPLPGIVSEQNKSKFDMLIFLTLAQAQKLKTVSAQKKSNGIVGITLEPIPDVSYTDQKQMVGLQKHFPWKITAKTDKGVSNIADDIIVQDAHWSIGK